MAAAVFLLVSSPLLYYNARFYGDALYNNNSRYCVWSDSWVEYQGFASKSHDRAHKDIHARALKTLRPEEIPSLRNYLRTHSAGFMVYRLKGGIRLNGLCWWKGRAALFLIALAAWALLILPYRKTALGEVRILIRDPAVLFSLCYAFLYFVTLSWYAAIAIHLRYVYPLHALLGVGLFLLQKRIRKAAVHTPGTARCP
jgi:hypothetical protein